MKEGFTIIEVAVVVGIVGLLLVLGLPISIEFYKNYLLTSEARNFLSILRRTESMAFANTNQSAHGLSLQADKFVLFQGLSYASRNVAYDEDYLRSPSIAVTGFSEIVFSPLSGRPNATSTIILSNELRSQTIDVNEEGAIFW